jgi:hypothetical protein
MFCNHCGGALQAGQAFCPGCGRPVIAPPAAQAPAFRGRVARHLTAVAIFWIVISAMRLFGAGGVMFAGRFARRAALHDPFISGFLPHIFPVISLFLLAGALIGFLCGWGLLQKHRWARTLALVLGGLSLLDPPLGTALGIYTLWVLLPNESEREYGAMARP